MVFIVTMEWAFVLTFFVVLGVSGGPDSMALCVLTAAWKSNSLGIAAQKNEFVDGLLAVVVDHGLRAESKDEAHLVHHRVTSMGIYSF